MYRDRCSVPPCGQSGRSTRTSGWSNTSIRRDPRPSMARKVIVWRKMAAAYPFEKFTDRAKDVLRLAQEEAERSHHSYIGTEHLLLGLLRQGEGLAAHVLANLGVDIEGVRKVIESVLVRNEPIVINQITPTSRVKKVIELSVEESRRMGQKYVGTEHVLLGLMMEGEGVAAHVLQDLGATLEKVRAEIERLEIIETKERPEPPVLP
jgi:ATP-dependent Clp protease ATP-binding subunit ClpA